MHSVVFGLIALGLFLFGAWEMTSASIEWLKTGAWHLQSIDEYVHFAPIETEWVGYRQILEWIIGVPAAIAAWAIALLLGIAAVSD